MTNRNRKSMRYLVITLTMIMIIAISSYGQIAYAVTITKPWYDSGVSEAKSWGIIPEGLNYASLNQPITRGEFAQAIIRAFISVNGEIPLTWGNDVFLDTGDTYANLAYELQFVSGYPDGNFKFDGLIKRDEMFVMIQKLIAKVQKVSSIEPVNIEKINSQFLDYMAIRPWATEAAALLINRSIITGTDLKTLEPIKETTRAQALIILKNALKTIADQPISFYRMTNTLERINTQVTQGPLANDLPISIDINFDQYFAEPTVKTIISRGSTRGYLSLEALYTPAEMMVMLGNNSVKYAAIFGSASALPYQSDAEAKTHLVTVSVDVWVLGSNGMKTQQMRSITVNEGISDTIIQIFKEIFEGPEKFPIKNLGGYAWRSSSTSEHRLGLAIDINPTENYMIRSDGTIVAGSFWKPFENPYSILPTGDVVSTFKKYGFTWGGDAWPMSNDYMHFSFLGM